MRCVICGEKSDHLTEDNVCPDCLAGNFGKLTLIENESVVQSPISENDRETVPNPDASKGSRAFNLTLAAFAVLVVLAFLSVIMNSLKVVQLAGLVWPALIAMLATAVLIIALAVYALKTDLERSKKILLTLFLIAAILVIIIPILIYAAFASGWINWLGNGEF
jgi:hypothetical protein